MILHTVKHSPFSTLSLKDCLEQISENDCLLLIEDAVVAASASFELTDELKKLHEKKQLFVLSADLKARALHSQSLFGQQIDYHDFVELAIKCKSQLAW